MKAPKILLVGYYGKGNFGDDVLLKTTHALLKEALPDAVFSVVIGGDAGGYVPKLLGKITTLKPGRHGHFDLIVHGGGGVHFDFTKHGWYDRLKETMMRGIGLLAYLALENSARTITGKKRTSAALRVGLGIGVGTYTFGSPRLRDHIATVADYDALWVRDAESVENLKRFNSILTGEIVLGSDLAFLAHYWLKVPAVRAASSRPRLGIVLRDWVEALGGLPEVKLQETIANLATTYDITGIILDQHADPVMQRILAPYPSCIWRPETMDIDDFMRVLSQQNVLLTSRAHGAICGACVGVPSVIVTIEPKLQQVAGMLPNASVAVSTQHPESWPDAVAKACAITPQVIVADIETNRAISAAAWEKIRRVML